MSKECKQARNVVISAFVIVISLVVKLLHKCESKVVVWPNWYAAWVV